MRLLFGFSCLLFCWSAIEIVINEVIRKIEMDALMNLTSIAIEFNGVIHAIGLPHTSLNDTTYAIVGCSGILILKGKKKIRPIKSFEKSYVRFKFNSLRSVPRIQLPDNLIDEIDNIINKNIEKNGKQLQNYTDVIALR